MRKFKFWKKNTVNKNGAHATAMAEEAGGRCELTEYDANGNRVSTVYGHFVDAPQYEDFDEYIASLEKSSQS